MTIPPSGGPATIASSGRAGSTRRAGKAAPSDDLVLRLDVYVGERDSFGVGFSDNVIFHRQLYVRAVLGPPTRLELHPDERFEGLRDGEETESGWKFGVTDPAFDATFGIDIFGVPDSGDPAPLDRA